MSTTVQRRDRRPTGRRVLGAGVLAGALAVAVNLAIRALVLALLDRPDVPYPLVLAPVIEFTFLPSLLGTLLFLLLRRTTARPVRLVHLRGHHRARPVMDRPADPLSA